MTVIHPRITLGSRVRPVENVLRSMRQLLAKRRHWHVSRKQFLVRWKKLRDELRATTDYRAFCTAVRERAGGVCERCGDLGTLAHHKRSIAYAVHLELDQANGEWLCRNCHTDEHTWLAA